MTELSPAYKAFHDRGAGLATFSVKGQTVSILGFRGTRSLLWLLSIASGSWLPLRHRLALLNPPNLRCLAALKFMVLSSQVLIDLMSSFNYKPEKVQ